MERYRCGVPGKILLQANFRPASTILFSCKCPITWAYFIFGEASNSQIPVCSNLKIATLIYPQNGYCQAIIVTHSISNMLAFNQLGHARHSLKSAVENSDQMPYSLSTIARLVMLQFPCPVDIPIRRTRLSNSE